MTEPAVAAAPRRRGRWRIVLAWTLLAAALLVAAVRIGAPRLLPGYLAQLAARVDLELRWKDLDLSLLRGRIEFTDVEVGDAGRPAAEPFARIALLRVDVDLPALLRREWVIERAEIDGLSGAVARRADGSFALGGWSPPRRPEAAPDAPAPGRFTLPFEVRQLRGSDLRLCLHDAAAEPALDADLAFELLADDLGSTRWPARIELRGRAVGDLGAIDLAARGSARGMRLSAELQLSASAVPSGLLSRFAPRLPVVPHARMLDFELDLSAELSAPDEGGGAWTGRAALDRLVLHGDGERELVLAARAELVRLGAEGVDIGRLDLDLDGRAARLESGGLRAAGLDFGPAVAASHPAGAKPPPTVDAARAGDRRYAVRIAEIHPTLALRLRDETSDPPAAVAATVRDSTLRNLCFVAPEDGVPVEVDLRLEAAGGALHLRGSVAPFAPVREARFDLRADLPFTGWKRLGLDAALGGDARATRLEGRVEVGFAAAARSSATVALRDLRLADGDRELLRVDSLRVEELALDGRTPARFELAGRVEGALDRLTVTGTATPDPEKLAADLELAAEGLRPGPFERWWPEAPLLRTADGRLRLRLIGNLDRRADGIRSGRLELRALELRDGPEAPPRIALDELRIVAPRIDATRRELELSELALSKLVLRPPARGPRDDAGGGAALVVDLRSRGPLVLGGDGEAPPLALDLVAAAPPLAEEVRASIQLSPFAARPAFDLALDVKGLSGGRLADVLPQVAARVDASAIEGGTCTARLSVALDVKRRSPTDFDLRGGFGATVELDQLRLHGSPDGPLLAGVDAVACEIASIRPASGACLVRSLEIATPRGQVRQTDRGLEFAGLLLLPAAEPLEEERGPPPELRIDLLAATGIDASFVDETVSPPFVLPLTGLDLEVRRFTTRAFDDPLPVGFHATVAAGSIELEKRDEGSRLGGMLDSATRVVTRAERVVVNEQRPAWESIELAGQTTLLRPLTGWVRFDVRGLELQALAALAAKSKVVIRDGVADAVVDARLRGDDGILVDSRTTFTWLSLAEPAGGPISSWLKLPVPLDTTLFLLRDSDGRQQVPLRFTVEAARVRRGEVARVATEALIRLIADAVKSTPSRVVSGALDATQLSRLPGVDRIPGLLDLQGLRRLFGGGSERDAPAPPIVLEFAPGETRLPPEALGRIEPLIERLSREPALRVTIQHQLGGEDRSRLAAMARPDGEEHAELGARLRRQRQELSARHRAAAAQARAALGTGGVAAAAPSLDELRSVARELAATERALDRVLGVHAGSAERDAERLVRDGSRLLAELRLAALRDRFERAGSAGLAERLDELAVRFTTAEGVSRSRIVLQPTRR